MKCGLSNIWLVQIHLKNDFKPLNIMLRCLLLIEFTVTNAMSSALDVVLDCILQINFLFVS